MALNYSPLPIRYSPPRLLQPRASCPSRRLLRWCRPCRRQLPAGDRTCLRRAPEALDGVGEVDELAGRAGEDFGDVERLRQEALDLAGAGHGDLVLFGQLVHAENGDDVLQRLVLLQHLLDHARGVVVLLADDQRGEHARGRVRAGQPPGRCPFPRSRGSAPWSRPDGRTRSRAPGRSSRRPARRSPAPK